MDVFVREIELKYSPNDEFNTISGRTEVGEIVEREGISYNVNIDQTKEYSLKIFLKSENIDFGLFNSVYENENIEEHEKDLYVISGICESRLFELENYGFDNSFSEKYKPNGNILLDGVDYVNSIENDKITYYIGGVKYVDDLINEETFYSFNSSQFEDNFINTNYVKLLGREGFSDEQVNNNIFIERQQISAFDGNNRLETLNRLFILETYAGGKFFNINNTK